MDVLKTTIKSAFLASSILSAFLLIENNHVSVDMIGAFLLILIIMFVMSLLMIVVTILPIYEIYKHTNSKKEIFHRFFPYYSIVFFLVCCGFSFDSYFMEIEFGMVVTAFLTGMMAWVWLFCPAKKPSNSD